MDNYIGFIMLLFFLSMICERVADFLKHYLSEANGGWGYTIKKILRIGDLVTKGKPNSIQEEKRYYRILKINIWCGFVTAWALHADVFTIINKITKPFEAIGWQNVTWIWDKNWQWKGSMTYEWVIFLIGCFATGCFISFGSKFWHDLLDILLQIKNYRRLIADPETFQTDNIKDFDQLVNTYESEIIHGAYTSAREKWKAVNEVAATALKHDDQGYYIEVTLKKDTPAITAVFEYVLDNGQVKNIRVIKKIVTDEILALSINLSDKIWNKKTPANKGTLGCIVKKTGKSDLFVLTCYHTIVEPGSAFRFSLADNNDVELSDNKTVIESKASFAVRDHEIDAALIAISKDDKKNITNQVPGLGTFSGVRENLTKSELAKNIIVSMHGAQSQFQKGVLTGIYCDVRIRYSDGEHQLINLLSISNNGKAISGPGDSGACIIDADNKLVGILVAGNSTTSYAIPATTVFNKLSLELITS
jgi:hypothetical protein